MRLILSLMVLVISTDGLNKNTRFQEYYRAAVEAYKKKDYTAMIRQLTSADSLRPNTHAVVYNLAAACALNGQPDDALHHLQRSLWLNADSGFTDDDDLVSLRVTTRWTDLLNQSRFFQTREFHATEAFRLSDSTFHPEGIAHDSASGAFFVGSIRNGQIARVVNGKVDLTWSRVPYSAMGMRIDKKNRTLWVASTAMPEFARFHDSLRGKAAVVAIDIENGNVKETYATEGSHVFGDLGIRSNGDVFVSDSEEPNIFRIRDGRLQLWHRMDDAWNLQGLDITADGRYLYVADYISGVYRIEIETKKTQLVLCEPMTAVRGIDGLRVHGNSLLAIQNGTRPFRVTQLSLDETGLRIGKLEFIARAAAELAEPTLGTLVGNDFYFIANSPWGAYDKAGQFDPQKARAPLILRAGLD